MNDAVIKKERNSNIELLRIISMLCIVAGHFVSQSNILKVYNVSNFNIVLLNIISNGSRIATNIFLMIGTWFMTDSSYKTKNVLRIYGQVAFYSIPITIIVAILGLNNSTKDILRGLMPFFGRPLWFASAYMTLLLVSPFLKKIIEWNIKELRLFVIILFVSISLVSTLPDIQESYVLDFCWFMYMYIFMGYMKKTDFFRNSKKHKNLILIIGLGIYFLLAFGNAICKIYADDYPILFKIKVIITQYIQDIKTVPNYICAFTIFTFFVSLEEKNNKIINYFASTSFGVYIFHQVPAFINILWYDIFQCNKWKFPEFMFLDTILTVIIVYIMGSVLDIIRKKFIERKFLNNKIANYLCKKMDDFLLTKNDV